MPRRPSSPPAPSSDSSTDAILRRLRWEATTVDELAKETGLTPNGVRAQLAALERQGWIRRAGVRRTPGAGKPATVFELVPAAEPRLSRAYLPVLVGLAQALVDREPRAERDAIYRRVGRDLANQQGGRPGADFETRLADAMRVLTDLGAVLEVERDRKRIVLRGAGCPLGAIVAVDQSACQATAALVSRLVGAPVTDRCERDGRPRCRFEINPAGPPAPARPVR